MWGAAYKTFAASILALIRHESVAQTAASRFMILWTRGLWEFLRFSPPVIALRTGITAGATRARKEIAASWTGNSPEGGAGSAPSRAGSSPVDQLTSLSSPEGNENAITLVLRQAEALAD